MLKAKGPELGRPGQGEGRGWDHEERGRSSFGQHIENEPPEGGPVGRRSSVMRWGPTAAPRLPGGGMIADVAAAHKLKHPRLVHGAHDSISRYLGSLSVEVAFAESTGGVNGKRTLA
jgi:hypothetical protein